MSRPARKHSAAAPRKIAEIRTVGDIEAVVSNDRLSPGLRWLISAAVVYHALAVFIGAWNGAPPTSPFSRAAQVPFRTYIGVLDLNHGYRFFAPDPGPSHLLRYELTYADGSTATGTTSPSTTGQGRVPDRVGHWPRLLYHRHFMLTEQLGAAADENVFKAMFRSYAAHLLRTSLADSVRVQYVRHTVAEPQAHLGGRALDAAESYSVLETLTLSRAELESQTAVEGVP